MRAIVATCALWLVASIAAAQAPCDFNNPSGQSGCNRFRSDDANARNESNFVKLIENNDADVVPLAQCTATESGVLLHDCCILQDLAATTAAEDWAWICGTQTYRLKPAAEPILSSAGNLVAIRYATSAGAVTRIEIFPQATDKPNEGNAAVTGTIAWAIGQFVNVMPAIDLMEGTFPTSTTLVWRSNSSAGTGGYLRGAGPSASRMLWIGNQRDPVLYIDDTQSSVFEDFSIKGTAATASCSAVGCAIRDAVVLINSVLDTSVPTKSQFKNITIDGNTTGILHSGFLFAAPNSEACTGDLAPWWLCSAAGRFATAAGRCCTDTDGTGCNTGETCDSNNGGGGSSPCNATRTKCVLGVNGNNDHVQFNQVRVLNGISNRDCTGAGAPAACCTGVDIGTCHSAGIRIEPDQSVEHLVLQSHFVGLTNAISTVSPVGGNSGTFFVLGGFGGTSAQWDFDIGQPVTGRSITVMLWRSEGGQGFINIGGPTSGTWSMDLLGSMFSPNAVINAPTQCTAAGVPEACCTGAGAGTCDVIGSFKQRVSLTMMGNTFHKSGSAPNIRFLINSLGNPTVMTATNNYVKSSNAAPFAVTHAADERWNLSGNIISDGNILSAIRDAAMSPIFSDVTSANKRMSIELDGITAGQVRTWTAPDRNLTIAGTSGTLTNGNIAAFNATGDLVNLGNPAACPANRFVSDLDAAGALTCAPSVLSGSVVPGSCTLGDPLFEWTSGTDGTRLYHCIPGGVYAAADNPFGPKIDPVDLSNVMTFGGAAQFDFAGAGKLIIPQATTPPGAPNQGQVFYDTDAAIPMRTMIGEGAAATKLRPVNLPPIQFGTGRHGSLTMASGTIASCAGQAGGAGGCPAQCTGGCTGTDAACVCNVAANSYIGQGSSNVWPIGFGKMTVLLELDELSIGTGHKLTTSFTPGVAGSGSQMVILVRGDVSLAGTIDMKAKGGGGGSSGGALLSGVGVAGCTVSHLSTPGTAGGSGTAGGNATNALAWDWHPAIGWPLLWGAGGQTGSRSGGLSCAFFNAGLAPILPTGGLLMGAASGGSGGCSGTGPTNGTPGNGGGGLILMAGGTVTLASGSAIDLGATSSQGGNAVGGAGGGSGVIIGQTVTNNGATFNVAGGPGGIATAPCAAGGAGGSGLLISCPMTNGTGQGCTCLAGLSACAGY